MVIQKVTVKAGQNKEGAEEKVEALQFYKGKIYAIVGPTGSGKTQLLEDIESLNDGSGTTQRTVLINDETPDFTAYMGERSQWIAHLSQSMNFVIDISVNEFLLLRCPLTMADADKESHVAQVLAYTNTLCGESFKGSCTLTALSGGQSRALMISDIAYNSDAQVVLMDELENAGIDRIRALHLLAKASKIILLVTHDPLLALHADIRIVMQNGGVERIIEKSMDESHVVQQLEKLDEWLSVQRTKIRLGESIVKEEVLYEIQGLLE